MHARLRLPLALPAPLAEAPRQRLAVIPVAMVMALALALAACGGGAEDDPADAPATATAEAGRSVPVEVFVVDEAAFEDVIQVTGFVEAPEDAVLSAEASGTLRSLLPLGQAVGRGQTVAQVDAGLAQAAVQQAEASLAAAQAQARLAEDQFRRQEPLLRDSIISPLEFESIRANRASAQAQVAQAQAQVAQARENLSRTRVIAPFAGTVEEHLARRGEQVGPGSPVARLVSGGGVKVTAGIPERYAGDVTLGTAVLVAPQPAGIAPRRGTISFVGRAVDPQSRTFPVEVRLASTDGTLKPQMIVRMEVTRATVERALAVPLSAVVRDESGPTVVVVEETDGLAVARVRRVTLGASAGGRVIVIDGLRPGDLVVIQGQTTVTDGELVRIMDRRAPLAPAALAE
jgi:membrane fusion protein, multidrug efflux system